MEEEDLSVPVQYINGLPFPGYFPAENIKSTLSMKPRDDDIFVVTYPKCGTHWVLYIIWSIINGDKSPVPSPKDLEANFAPFLEFLGADYAEKFPSPRVMKLHLPYGYTPLNGNSKYIYVSRDPRDCAASYFHFARDVLGGPEYSKATFGQFFEQFISGDLPFGDYFDHLISWRSHLADNNVLYLTYEEMSADLGAAILRIGRFISTCGVNYEQQLLKDETFLRKVVESSTFKSFEGKTLNIRRDRSYLARNPDALSAVVSETADEVVIKVNLFRKGVVGDWVNYFSEDQLERLRRKMHRRMKEGALELTPLYSF